MSKLIEWAPSEYSPTYLFYVDDAGNFENLHRVHNIPTGWPQSKEIEVHQYHIEYMSGDGFEKFKKYMAWLGDDLYKSAIHKDK